MLILIKNNRDYNGRDKKDFNNLNNQDIHKNSRKNYNLNDQNIEVLIFIYTNKIMFLKQKLLFDKQLNRLTFQ